MLPEIIILVFIVAVVSHIDATTANERVGTKWNGVGSVPSVLRGEALSPMQHRVLIPWLCKLFSGMQYDWRGYRYSYNWIKFLGVSFAIFSSWIYFQSLLGVALLALYLCWTAKYDYADAYYEIGFLCVAFTAITQSWGLVILVPVVFLAALNRETALIIPAVCLVSGDIVTGLILSLVFYGGYQLPRLAYGAKERYCEWFTLRRNLELIKTGAAEHVPFAMVCLAMVGLYAVSWPWGPSEVVLGVFFVAMLVPSVWREIRVFAPALLALVPMAVRYLNVA